MLANNSLDHIVIYIHFIPIIYIIIFMSILLHKNSKFTNFTACLSSSYSSFSSLFVIVCLVFVMFSSLDYNLRNDDVMPTLTTFLDDVLTLNIVNARLGFAPLARGFKLQNSD